MQDNQLLKNAQQRAKAAKKQQIGTSTNPLIADALKRKAAAERLSAEVRDHG